MNYRELARGARCYTCGVQDDSVVLAHYSGLRQHLFGKGRGIKGRDFYAAPQCAECHDKGPFAEGWQPLDRGLSRDMKKLIASEEQLLQILQWHEDLDLSEPIPSGDAHQSPQRPSTQRKEPPDG